jgi:succinate dehydrogenase/fumarate reductase flavoprotein subunit
MEPLKGRRVFLEFRRNPLNKDVDFSKLSDEPGEYLKNAGACFGTPIERLLHMNAPAVSFYMDKGVDLVNEPLEIALCAQHNNGGLDVDCWWQTNIKGFFAVGEAAASHGVYRPGGSALNSGQVGSTRAARFIAARCRGDADEDLSRCISAQIAQTIELGEKLNSGDPGNAKEICRNVTKKMSLYGGPIRDIEGILQTLHVVKAHIESFADTVRVSDVGQLKDAFRLWDILICQQVFLEAMADYCAKGGKSRGSALYTDKNGSKPYSFLPDAFTFRLDDGSRADEVQQVAYKNGICNITQRKVRSIPDDDDFFENVWRGFRENENIDV